MALILSLETSTDVCSVALHESGELIGHQLHQVEKSHSSLLPGIVLKICDEAGVDMKSLKAVAVSEGPGSYTGLRIGISTAKGFAYTLNTPIIAIPTLDVILEAVRGKFKGDHLLCAMMDARRMEVYLKMEDQAGNEVLATQPMILEEDTFSDYTLPTYLFGNGMPKFKEISSQQNLIFIDEIVPDAANMGSLALSKYQVEDFEDVAYFEPNYLKEWRTTTPKKKLV